MKRLKLGGDEAIYIDLIHLPENFPADAAWKVSPSASAA